MTDASQLALFIVDEINEGTSLEDIKKLLLELDDVTAEYPKHHG